MKTVKVRVLAPAGRFIPGYGNREKGEFYTLPEEVAIDLVGRDSGLELVVEPSKRRSKPRGKDEGTVNDES